MSGSRIRPEQVDDVTVTEEAPRGVDSTIPNVARIYDYLLGGKDNISQEVRAVFRDHA
jgi:hypothetical protein